MGESFASLYMRCEMFFRMTASSIHKAITNYNLILVITLIVLSFFFVRFTHNRQVSSQRILLSQKPKKLVRD